jgi:hypothetical protein
MVSHATPRAMNHPATVSVSLLSDTCPSSLRYGKYGYTGVDYCKACSESFRSHLFRSHSSMNGCRREAPCGHCAKVLGQFECSPSALFDRVDGARTRRASQAATKTSAKRGAPKRKRTGSAFAALTKSRTN